MTAERSRVVVESCDLARAGWELSWQLRVESAASWLLIIAYKLIVTVLYYGYARQAVSIDRRFSS